MQRKQNPRSINVDGYEMLEKIAKFQGKKSSSCTIYVPRRWRGKTVVIIRVDE